MTENAGVMAQIRTLGAALAAQRDAGIVRGSFVPPYGSGRDALTADLLRQGIAASLAGGIIAASGKPHTVDEALAVFAQVRERIVGEGHRSEETGSQ